MLELPTKDWWETDTYTGADPLPAELSALAGPHGVPLVKVFSNGATQPGWGVNGANGSAGFMVRYKQGEFNPARALTLYGAGGDPFAIVMRGLSVVCVDIDGKNGGLEYIGQLGQLPLTLAETSKSGNGYHLFYSVEDEWLDDLGFDSIPDQIGITQGVDIRGTGCVYHYNTQRWNNRPITPVPDWLREKLQERRRRRQALSQSMQKISTLDEMERIMAHSELRDELAQPIPAGRRNNSLFAIGSKMMQAGDPTWEKAVTDRALSLKMSQQEAEKIVENIGRYGHSV